MTIHLVTIDPGLRHLGIAHFIDGRVRNAGLVFGEQDTNIQGAEAWVAMGRSVQVWCGEIGISTLSEIVYEKMQAYRRDGNKNTAALLELSGVTGAVLMAVPHAKSTGYTPRQWKGQVKKEIHNKRMWSRLTLEEKQVLHRDLAHIEEGLRHNVADAVGIGLRHLKRTK